MLSFNLSSFSSSLKKSSHLKNDVLVRVIVVILTIVLLPGGAEVSLPVSTPAGGPSPEGSGAWEAPGPTLVINAGGEGDYPGEGVPRHGGVGTTTGGGRLPGEERVIIPGRGSLGPGL